MFSAFFILSLNILMEMLLLEPELCLPRWAWFSFDKVQNRKYFTKFVKEKITFETRLAKKTKRIIYVDNVLKLAITNGVCYKVFDSLNLFFVCTSSCDMINSKKGEHKNKSVHVKCFLSFLPRFHHWHLHSAHIEHIWTYACQRTMECLNSKLSRFFVSIF